ncbi:MAG: hypothetical protein H7319_09945 [Spirosoma sp.]|nr:hypothetical protein [Spirosoma sp.]
MEQQDFRTRYQGIWKTFAKQIQDLSHELIEAGGSTDSSPHKLLSDLQSVTYEEAKFLFDELLKKENEEDEPVEKKTNIGSITGLFFEIIAASIVKGYMEQHVPGISIELNRCSNADIGASNPDIFIHYKGRHIIFETKASPKKKDLEGVIFSHHKYNSRSQNDTMYFLIGGYVSARKELLQQMEGWACFTNGSKRNSEFVKTFRLDPLLKEAVTFLQSAS